MVVAPFSVVIALVELPTLGVFCMPTNWMDTAVAVAMVAGVNV
jgi:hypothetical protein